MNTQEIEKRSLAPSRWANLFMAVSGVTAGIMSNTSALMLDGLFSGVNFLDLSAVKTGRSVFAVAYIRPDTGPVVNDLDELRLTVQNSCAKVLPVVKTEIVYTGSKPFD